LYIREGISTLGLRKPCILPPAVSLFKNWATNKQDAEDYLAGRMFWFMRNRLSGS
jgi:hypothetical protein